MSEAENQITKIENLFKEHLPYIKKLITEKIGPSARGAAENEEICRLVANQIYKFLPLPIRLFISESKFAEICWENRHIVFPKERKPDPRETPDNVADLVESKQKGLIENVNQAPDKLKQLEELCSAGVISAEELNSAKQRLLSLREMPNPGQSFSDCSNEKSDTDNSYQDYGRANIGSPPQIRSVSLLLGLGIFFMPYIFSWFTLRKEHTTKAKIVSFGWLAVFLFAFYQDKVDTNLTPKIDSAAVVDTQSVSQADAIETLPANKNNEAAADNQQKSEQLEVIAVVDESKDEINKNSDMTFRDYAKWGFWIIVGMSIIGVFSSSAKKKCDICKIEIKRKSYTWKQDGKNLELCPKCNGQMERKISKEAFKAKVS